MKKLIAVETYAQVMALFQLMDATLVGGLSGSISAGHGIGLMKKNFLCYSRNQE